MKRPYASLARGQCPPRHRVTSLVGNTLETSGGERRRTAATRPELRSVVCRHIATDATGGDNAKAHGKEGVDGSSPSEGSAKAPEIGACCLDSLAGFPACIRHGAFMELLGPRTPSWQPASTCVPAPPSRSLSPSAGTGRGRTSCARRSGPCGSGSCATCGAPSPSRGHSSSQVRSAVSSRRRWARLSASQSQ